MAKDSLFVLLHKPVSALKNIWRNRAAFSECARRLLSSSRLRGRRRGLLISSGDGELVVLLILFRYGGALPSLFRNLSLSRN